MNRRLIFRGQATGLAGQLRWPKEQLIPVQAASALPVTGGLSESKVTPARKLPYVSYRQAVTRAFGDFTSLQGAIDIIKDKLGEDQVPSRTEVFAHVRELVIGGRVKIGLTQATLVSERPRPGQDLPIKPQDLRLDRIAVDGYKLRVALWGDLMARHDTKTKLAKAYSQTTFRKKFGCRFFFPGAPNAAAGDPAQLPESGGYVYCTLVETMAWEGKPHPEARIEGNLVTIPDFGRIYFAEMLIGSLSRRLTMVRAVLGSPDGGTLSAADVETNGVFWPA